MFTDFISSDSFNILFSLLDLKSFIKLSLTSTFFYALYPKGPDGVIDFTVYRERGFSLYTQCDLHTFEKHKPLLSFIPKEYDYNLAKSSGKVDKGIFAMIGAAIHDDVEYLSHYKENPHRDSGDLEYLSHWKIDFVTNVMKEEAGVPDFLDGIWCTLWYFGGPKARSYIESQQVTKKVKWIKTDDGPVSITKKTRYSSEDPVEATTYKMGNHKYVISFYRDPLKPTCYLSYSLALAESEWICKEEGDPNLVDIYKEAFYFVTDGDDPSYFNML